MIMSLLKSLIGKEEASRIPQYGAHRESRLIEDLLSQFELETPLPRAQLDSRASRTTWAYISSINLLSIFL